MDRVNASVASMLRNEGNFSDAQKLFPLSRNVLEVYYPNGREQIGKLFPYEPQAQVASDFLVDGFLMPEQQRINKGWLKK